MAMCTCSAHYCCGGPYYRLLHRCTDLLCPWTMSVVWNSFGYPFYTTNPCCRTRNCPQSIVFRRHLYHRISTVRVCMVPREIYNKKYYACWWKLNEVRWKVILKITGSYMFAIISIIRLHKKYETRSYTSSRLWFGGKQGTRYIFQTPIRPTGCPATHRAARYERKRSGGHFTTRFSTILPWEASVIQVQARFRTKHSDAETVPSHFDTKIPDYGSHFGKASLGLTITTT